MKIDRHKQAGLPKEQLSASLKALLDVPKDCKNLTCWTACPCPEQKPACSMNCPGVKTALSSDPEHYPLEGKIAPLVYELSRLQVFQPCWSCEGHESSTGNLWKLPQVWFYAQAEIQVRLLSDCLRTLAGHHRIHTEWEISITRSAPDDPETTFCLKPVPSDGQTLSELQHDITILARDIPDIIRNEARKMLSVVN